MSVLRASLRMGRTACNRRAMARWLMDGPQNSRSALPRERGEVGALQNLRLSQEWNTSKNSRTERAVRLKDRRQLVDIVVVGVENGTTGP